MKKKVVNLTKEDKKRFKTEVKSVNPVDLLILARFVNSSSLSKNDKKFCNTHMGMRAERLLKNVVQHKMW